MTTVVARLRERDVPPARFLKLAFASAVSLYLIIISGSLVRLTGSGLGCESWPGCQSRSFFPANDIHGTVEFANRVVSILPLSLSIVAAVAAYRTVGIPRWARRVAAATAAGTFAQAPLGLLTIRTDLHPLMVMAHFLLALAVLAGAVVVVIEAWRLHRGDEEVQVPQVLRRAGGGALLALLAMIVTGAFVTAAGPHPGDRADIRRLFNIHDTLWVHVRATAVFAVLFAGAVAYLTMHRARFPSLWRASLVVLALLVVQMAVGEYQYRRGLPWEVVLVHVALAAAVWTAAVAFVALLWRPLRA